jgi:hypothetical protein
MWDSFMGWDLDFLLFFSLTEHLVFALQALPFALVPGVWVLGAILLPMYGTARQERHEKEFAERLKQMTLEDLQRERTKLISRGRWFTIGSIFGRVASCVGAIWFFLHHQYLTSVGWLISAFVWDIVPISFKDQISPARKIVIAFSAISLGWITAFALGYERAENVITSTIATELVSSQTNDIAGQIVRGGEAGILLFSVETRKLIFLRWDSVTRIETIIR